MKWRSIRILILLFLVSLNAGTAFYLNYEEKQMTTVSEERMQAICAIYERAGIEWNVEPDREHTGKAYIMMSAVDVSRYVTENKMISNYQPYIFASGMRYETETETVIANRETSTIEYLNFSQDKAETDIPYERIRRAAEDYIQSTLPIKTGLVLESESQRGDRHRFVFHQIWQGEELFFNRVSIMMEGETVRNFSVTYYLPMAVPEKEYRIEPMDELLYRCYKLLEQDEKLGKVHALEKISYGYRLDEDLAGIPCAVFVFDDGSEYVLDRIATG